MSLSTCDQTVVFKHDTMYALLVHLHFSGYTIVRSGWVNEAVVGYWALCGSFEYFFNPNLLFKSILVIIIQNGCGGLMKHSRLLI